MCYVGAALMSQNTFPRSSPYLRHIPAFIFQLLKGNSQWGWKKPRRVGNTGAQRRKRLKEQEMVTYSRWRHWEGQNWEGSTWEAGGYWYLNQYFQWRGGNGSSKNGLSEVSMQVRKWPFSCTFLLTQGLFMFPGLERPKVPLPAPQTEPGSPLMLRGTSQSSGPVHGLQTMIYNLWPRGPQRQTVRRAPGFPNPGS